MKLHQVVLPHGFHISFFFCISIFEKDPQIFWTPTLHVFIFPSLANATKDTTPAQPAPQVFTFFHLRRRPTDIWNLPSQLSLCSAKRRHTWIFCDNQKLIIWFILTLIINDCHWWRRRSLDQQIAKINICSLSTIIRIQDHTWLVFLCPPRSHCGRSHHLQTRKP